MKNSHWTKAAARSLVVLLPALALPIGLTSPAEYVNRPYLELAEIAHTLSFDTAAMEAYRGELAHHRKAELDKLKLEQKQLDEEITHLREQLKALNKEASSDTPEMTGARLKVHCDILRLEKLRREKRVAREHGVGVAFENKLAKLALLEQWPKRRAEIRRIVGKGKARQRSFGDVEDIGVRGISKDKDQEKDIKRGEEALKELKMYSLVPSELENKEVKRYVQGIADRVATNSDVKVPVKLTILFSPEINAFALPGGYLFVNTGLIQRTEMESELAGVIAHELAHVSARHGAKLMKRANIASLIFQMAQIAVLVGTGGVGSIGAYYLYQAGFLGLGLVLDLSLLGVSREFETEADQLGAQYAWKAGYDPRGFISFFDKMASEKGYVQSASFFRTHPPYLERIMASLSEIEYLPKGDPLAVDSSKYQDFKQQLTKALQGEGEEKRKNAPTLRRGEECPKDEAEAGYPVHSASRPRTMRLP